MAENVGFLKQVQDAYAAAREMRQEQEVLWEKCMAAYRCQYDFSNRLPWQSQNALPKIAKDTDFVAQTVADACGDSQEKLFTLIGNGQWGKLAAPIMEAVLSAHLEKLAFADNMRGMVTYGLLTPGLAAKVTPQPGPWPGWCDVEPLSYRAVFKDPTGRNKFLLIVTAHDKADVVEMAKANGWDVKLASNLGDTGDADARRDVEIWLRGAASAAGWPQTSAENLRKTVFVMEYYGPVYDDSGNRVMEWGYGVVANNSVVLHGPQDAPFGQDNAGNVRKLASTVVGDLMSDPFSVYPKPMMLDALPLAQAQVDVANLILDQAQLQVNAIGINFDAIEGAGEPGAKVLKQITSTTGVNPGQPVPFRGSAPPLVPLELARFNPQLLDVYAMMDQERQSATGASDMVRGLSATEDTSSQTLGEFQEKQATGGKVLTGFAKGVEKRFLEPLIELMLWHYRNEGFSLIGADQQNSALNAVAGSEIEAAIDTALADGLIENGAMAQAEMLAQQAGAQALMDGLGPPDEAAVGAVMDAARQQDAQTALAMLDEACRDEFQVFAAGVSAVMDRGKALGKLMANVELAMKVGAQSAVDRGRVLATASRLSGVDANDWLKEDFETLLEQEEQMAMQAAQQMAAMGPPEDEDDEGEEMRPQGRQEGQVNA